MGRFHPWFYTNKAIFLPNVQKNARQEITYRTRLSSQASKSSTGWGAWEEDARLCALQPRHNVHLQSRSKAHVLSKPILGHPVFYANRQGEPKYSNSLLKRCYGILICNTIHTLSWNLARTVNEKFHPPKMDIFQITDDPNTFLSLIQNGRYILNYYNFTCLSPKWNQNAAFFPASCTFRPNNTGKGTPLKIPSAFGPSIRAHGANTASFLIWSQCLGYVHHSASSTPTSFSPSSHTGPLRREILANFSTEYTSPASTASMAFWRRHLGQVNSLWGLWYFAALKHDAICETSWAF